MKGPSKVTNGIVLPKAPAAVNQTNKETDVPKVGTDDTVLIFHSICNFELYLHHSLSLAVSCSLAEETKSLCCGFGLMHVVLKAKCMMYLKHKA